MNNRKYYLYFFLLLIFNWSTSQKNNSCIKTMNPSKVVVAGGSITEILYFLNLEEKIVGVDVTSNFPEETKEIQSVGYVRNLSSEGILSLEPTIVLGEDDMGPPTTISQINESGIDLRIISENQNIDGIIYKIMCVGSIMGKEYETENIINTQILNQANELKNIQKKNNLKDLNIMLVLSMQPSSIIVAGNNTSGNSFIKMLGAKNIFDSFEGWKSVSKESIIKKNPDYILIPEKNLHKNSEVEKLSEDLMFKNTNAGKKGNFIFEDGMAMLGFGPRTILSALKIAKIINE